MPECKRKRHSPPRLSNWEPPRWRLRANVPSGIYVLARTNGAGKSSVAGAMHRASGRDYFNPDEAASAIRRDYPAMTATDANSTAWQVGKRLLENAMADRSRFAFETTLGGSTITSLLADALDAGIEVRIWYVGLATPELHIARILARVRKGGHPIDDARIRDRFDHSRLNLIRLLPKLTEIRVHDNSLEADAALGHPPQLKLLLHWRAGKIVRSRALPRTPQWAKPILAAALTAATRR